MEVIKKCVSVYIAVVPVGIPLSSCAQYDTLRLVPVGIPQPSCAQYGTLRQVPVSIPQPSCAHYGTLRLVPVGIPQPSCAQYGTLSLLLRCLVYKVVLPELHRKHNSKDLFQSVAHGLQCIREHQWKSFGHCTSFTLISMNFCEVDKHHGRHRMGENEGKTPFVLD